MINGTGEIWRGGAGGRPFADTVDSSIDRSNVRFVLPQDSRLYLTEFSRTRVNEKAEWLWQNFGVVKEMTAGTARHAVGKGIIPQFNTSNLEWNAQVLADVEKWALTPDRCDLAGRRNLYDAELAAIEQYIIRGEFVAAHMANPRWKAPKSGGVDAPAFWILDTNDLKTPPPTTAGATGKRILDGVELGAHSETTGFWVRMFDQTFKRFEANEICHWFKPHAVHQVRGVSHFAQAVNSLVDIHELKRLTTRTAKAQQLIALVLKGVSKKKGRGAVGALRRAGTGNGSEDSTAADTAELEQLYGGAGAGIAYLDEKGDAKLLNSNAPSPLMEPFISDLLMRDASLAPGVPAEFFWNPAKLGGANNRFILARADLFFQFLADALIYRWLEPLIVRYVNWRIANGFLPKAPDENWADSITYQLPARVTVDNARDGKLEVELIKNGCDNLRGFYARRGMSWRPETLQWIREWKEFKAMCAAEGMNEEEAEKLMLRWRPPTPGSVPVNEQETETKPAKTDGDNEEAA